LGRKRKESRSECEKERPRSCEDSDNDIRKGEVRRRRKKSCRTSTSSFFFVAFWDFAIAKWMVPRKVYGVVMSDSEWLYTL